VRVGRSLSAAATILTVAAPITAQEASLFLGGVHTRYADTVSGTAGTVGARLGLRSPSLTAIGEGHYTRFTTGTWATQLNGGLVALHGVGRNAAVGLRADGNHSYLQGGLWSGIAAAGPMVGVAGNRWFLGISATGGGVRTIYETSDAIVTGSVRGTYMLRAWNLDARVTTTWAGDLRYGDLLVAANYNTQAFTASLAAGIRAGDLADDPWVQGRAEWRFAKGVSFEAAVGTYPEDITGFLSGFFVNAGLRIGRQTPVIPAPHPSPIRIETLSPREVRVTFTVRDASTVALAGEWNQWTPIPLSRVDSDQWQMTLPLGAGVYHFSLVVDESWIVPEGVARLPDDFGGEVGLLVVSHQ